MKIKQKTRFCVLFIFVCLTLGILTACSINKSATASPPDSVDLWPDGAPVDAEGNTEKVPVPLYIRLPENSSPDAKIPAVVICPGGGYGGLCIEPEGFGIADWLNKNGIAGFVLEYRLPKGRSTVPLSDAARAIRWVRCHAAEYGVDPNQIGIIGFSAGGHLASTAATHFDNGQENATDPVEKVSSRPDFAILIYPVILMNKLGDSGTSLNLLGENAPQEQLDYYSNEKHVDSETPPTFLAHAVDDSVVPIENSRIFAQKMKEFGRPYVLLELPNGNHGLNGYKGPSWDRWQSEAAKWIKSNKE